LLCAFAFNDKAIKKIMIKMLSTINRLKKSFFIISIFFMSFVFNTNHVSAQTTRTVGSGGNYATLKDAFDAINAGSITGSLTLQIISNTS
jgi:hypothetical protein